METQKQKTTKINVMLLIGIIIIILATGLLLDNIEKTQRAKQSSHLIYEDHR